MSLLKLSLGRGTILLLLMISTFKIPFCPVATIPSCEWVVREFERLAFGQCHEQDYCVASIQFISRMNRGFPGPWKQLKNGMDHADFRCWVQGYKDIGMGAAICQPFEWLVWTARLWFSIGVLWSIPKPHLLHTIFLCCCSAVILSYNCVIPSYLLSISVLFR